MAKPPTQLPAQKPRNLVAKNAASGGAGAHKDKKKALKQGDQKHKNKDYAESLAFELARQLAEGPIMTPQGSNQKWGIVKHGGLPEDGATPGYIKYEQMKDKIAGVLIKLYDQGKDIETIKQMGGRIAKHLGYDTEDETFQDAFLSSFTDASLDGAFDNPEGDDDYTDYSMRQGEMGNPDRMREGYDEWYARELEKSRTRHPDGTGSKLSKTLAKLQRIPGFSKVSSAEQQRVAKAVDGYLARDMSFDQALVLAQKQGVAESEGEPEGVPHLTPEIAKHILEQIESEGVHAVVKSLQWGDGAATELLELFKKALNAVAFKNTQDKFESYFESMARPTRPAKRFTDLERAIMEGGGDIGPEPLRKQKTNESYNEYLSSVLSSKINK